MFQFTHPGRGATRSSFTRWLVAPSFNSRTPGGVRLHKPERTLSGKLFQFTHPGRGATRCLAQPLPKRQSFNSRTPGGVRLALFCESSRNNLCFNSRTPGGVRLLSLRILAMIWMFQFTHPGRGATRATTMTIIWVEFQFTHPGRGATLFQIPITQVLVCFNSRTPGGVRHWRSPL